MQYALAFLFGGCCCCTAGGASAGSTICMKNRHKSMSPTHTERWVGRTYDAGPGRVAAHLAEDGVAGGVLAELLRGFGGGFLGAAHRVVVCGGGSKTREATFVPTVPPSASPAHVTLARAYAQQTLTLSILCSPGVQSRVHFCFPSRGEIDTTATAVESGCLYRVLFSDFWLSLRPGIVCIIKLTIQSQDCCGPTLLSLSSFLSFVFSLLGFLLLRFA
jgi:hypothetical protein